jgi:hypothetical protein
MSDEWYVLHEGQPHGPLTLAQLAQAIEAGQVSASAYLSNPRLPWTCAEQIEAVSIARAVHNRAQIVEDGGEFLWVPAPPQGGHWFHPIRPLYILLLGALSFGLYDFVWRYRQRQWARRRFGLATKPIGLVFRGAFDIRLDITLAAQATGVRRSFVYGPQSDGLAALWWTLYICCWPGAAVISAASAWEVYATAERVNRAVAPHARRPGLGFAELLVVVMAIPLWVIVFLGLTGRL